MIFQNYLGRKVVGVMFSFQLHWTVTSCTVSTDTAWTLVFIHFEKLFITDYYFDYIQPFTAFLLFFSFCFLFYLFYTLYICENHGYLFNINPDVLSYAYQLLFYITLPCIPPFCLSCVKIICLSATSWQSRSRCTQEEVSFVDPATCPSPD